MWPSDGLGHTTAADIHSQSHQATDATFLLGGFSRADSVGTSCQSRCSSAERFHTEENPTVVM